MSSKSRIGEVASRLEAIDLSIRPMTGADRDEVVHFADGLPDHDLLFLRRDITDREAVEEWLKEIESGRVTTLLALSDDEILGYATLDRSQLPWSSHVAEIRVVVGDAARGKGLGRLLIEEAFQLAIAEGIEKIVARMTPDQKGAIRAFEGLGFQPEGLLKDHVRDLSGEKHDLLVMAHDVAAFHGTLTSYGVPQALGEDAD